MKPLKFSVALQVLLVFASGALVGVLGYRLYDTHTNPPIVRKGPPPPEKGKKFRERYVSEMRSRLHLDANQMKRLDEIMESTGRSFWEAKKRNDAEVRSLQEHQQAQIRAMLDPGQVVEYEKMLKEREERMRFERDPRRPRP